METNNNERRKFIKSTLAGSLLINCAWARADAAQDDGLIVPDKTQDELNKLYGHWAYTVYTTDKLVLKVPDIAENGAVVPVYIMAEKGLFSSIALFVEENPNPLAAMCRLHPAAEPTLGLHVKVRKTSNIILVAQADSVLFGVKKLIKVTVGCGGG